MEEKACAEHGEVRSDYLDAVACHNVVVAHGLPLDAAAHVLHAIEACIVVAVEHQPHFTIGHNALCQRGIGIASPKVHFDEWAQAWIGQMGFEVYHDGGMCVLQDGVRCHHSWPGSFNFSFGGNRRSKASHSASLTK